MRILVVGASGYIGGRLVPQLATRGHDLVFMGRDARPLAARFPLATVVAADLLDPSALPSALERIEVAYKSGGVLKLSSYQVYNGGALVLFALRQKIGAAAFEQVERAWVQRYRDSVASTDDFIALATEISGDQSVTAFLREWLYGEKTPPMPGHPDWTVNPVGSITTTSSTDQVPGLEAWQP